MTHDQIEAITLADRIVIMDKGHIQQVGTPDQIYSDPARLCFFHASSGLRLRGA